MSRRFTLELAQSILPELTYLMREVLAAKPEFEKADHDVQALAQKVTMMGGIALDRDRAVAGRNRREQAGARLKQALEAIQEMGCLVKDLDTGLVDFPTLFRGEEVYLCWKLGEPAIRFWHGVQEGFAGRKPIDQDFLANHRGDSTQ